MDLYCPKCREPWDNDCIHEEVQARGLEKNEATTYSEVYQEFTVKGCEALATAYDGEHGDLIGGTDPAIAAIYEMAGDDSDFAMSMLDEMGL